MPKSRFSKIILAWYELNKRPLPWRENNNPYSIWLSEIILQQTRVAQGLPYFTRFLEQYPSVTELAQAPEDEVLRLWQGLGYYSRARNLHKCAKTIVEHHNGIFPETMEELKSLPGIGNYTAAAIASLAFNQPVPVVDGNVYRLLSRYFGITTDISSSSAFREFYSLANTLIDKSRPGDFNQSMMELGALQCTPKQPDCFTCPLMDSCFANAKHKQAELPVKLKKTKVRQRYFHYFLIKSGRKILFHQRLENDIWQGLYEFPSFESEKRVTLADIEHPLLEQIHDSGIDFMVEDKILRHVLSHQVLNVNFVVINVDEPTKEHLDVMNYKWYSIEAAEALPKPVLIANYLDSYLNSIHLQEEKN